MTGKMVAGSAHRSTRPRSEEGKKWVRFNGLRHGQRVGSSHQAIIALGGDPADFDRIIKEGYFEPQTQGESNQVKQMAREFRLPE